MKIWNLYLVSCNIFLSCTYTKPSYCAFYKKEGLKKIQSDKFSSFLKTFEELWFNNKYTNMCLFGMSHILSAWLWVNVDNCMPNKLQN